MLQNATFSSDARDGHSEPSCSMCSLRLHMLLQWRGSPKHVSANIHQDGRLVVGSRRSKWKTPVHPDLLCSPLHRLSVADKPQSKIRNHSNTRFCKSNLSTFLSVQPASLLVGSCEIPVKSANWVPFASPLPEKSGSI